MHKSITVVGQFRESSTVHENTFKNCEKRFKPKSLEMARQRHNQTKSSK